MPRKQIYPPPADADIMQYANVPVELAARFVGSSSATLYRALQEERAPFGFAVQCGKGWGYNISPGLLIKYKNGDLPTYRLKEIQDIAAEGIERILNEKTGVLVRIAGAIGA